MGREPHGSDASLSYGGLIQERENMEISNTFLGYADEIIQGLEFTDEDRYDLYIGKGSGGTVIRVELDFDDISDTVRRNAKRIVDLAVPNWASEGYKTLFGETDYVPGVKLEIMLRGAFECKVVGEIEEPVGEYAMKHAENLENMTPEQALEHVRASAAALKKPRTKASWSCKPKV